MIGVAMAIAISVMIGVANFCCSVEIIGVFPRGAGRAVAPLVGLSRHLVGKFTHKS